MTSANSVSVKQRNSRGLPWLVGRWWFWALAISILFAQPIVRTLLRPPPILPKVYGRLSEFKLTREDGRTFGSDNLKGKVWVASFIALSDAHAAEKMEGMMHQLHRRLRKLGDSFRLVTFTVDPSHDSAPLLAAYSQAHLTNQRIWSYVTGDRATLESIVSNVFKVQMGPSADGAPFVLVDGDGQFRGAYHPEDQDGMNSLVGDVGLLVNNY